ncbi:putative Ribosomal protein L11 methyltransferase [Streptomyces afghaniensis 772]|uniref:Putative Ribosomal protein L11 methyltransferase n=1 Tax=Streptomyces afghaniensis 772 TaxID=1283301 RepID=S4NMV7_9ACTN|nr:class I SAM-dependent methyltransferase [Streptomyces afghaniensis]EPJ39724.1 putative Ribosomal protein L11 methyltransferase [Streptomyces afghaniensis 772]
MSTIRWIEAQARSARWHSESGLPLPRRVVVADDRMRAAVAYRLACEGTALLWRGDYYNARQLLRAMDRRIGRAAPGAAGTPAESFRLYRRFRAHRARVLGKLLVLLEEDHTLALRRAPDVSRACVEAYGPSDGPVAVALTELLGVISAREWRENGVHVPALNARIHPHYGVFAPTRSEYVDLVARAPLPPGVCAAFDLGTGTGVLAAVLARRGVRQVVATDVSARARACAWDNVRRLGFGGTVRVAGPDLYPEGRAHLVVCNPPWIPARPASDLDLGVYDAGGGMLHGFLDGLAGRLEPGGEGWLVLSDLAERLGLRTRAELLTAIEAAGLRIVDRLDTRPRHARVRDRHDPLHAARAAEVTSLWRLAVP